MNRQILAGLLFSALAMPQLAQAAPRGPSAIKAAQLKKRASGWLAFYLPEDRYKVAGGVWKFVSTDLDTYYHRPDSPNILRQSPARIIGFSSAQEAQDAGYLPDPSDGTASGTSARLSGLGNLNTNAGRNPAEIKYLTNLSAVAEQQLSSLENLKATFVANRNSNSIPARMTSLKQQSSQAYRDTSKLVTQLRRAPVPKRFRRFHNQLVNTFTTQKNLWGDIYNFGSSGNLQFVGQMRNRVTLLGRQYNQLATEAKKVGLE